MTLEVCALIEEKIQLDVSPEQLSGWLRTEKDIKISHERIYQHFWADKRGGESIFLRKIFPGSCSKISKNYATANACDCTDSSCFTRCTPNKGGTA
jgi:IS30 family transposase